jgi:hypothetical protein
MNPHKEFGIVPIIVGILVVILGAFVFIVLPYILHPTTYLKLGDATFKAWVATSGSDRAKGLIGIDKLNSDQALLMVFPNQDKWVISMKDMTVPIDIVWLNSDKKVVFVVKNTTTSELSPESFTPKSVAKYVVELPAGTIDSKSIESNAIATFQINAQGM